MRIINLITSAILTITLGTISSANALVANGPAGPDFYNPPASAKGKPGDLIWIREITSMIPNSKAWKILYWSTTADNKIVPVSGILVTPQGKADVSGRPVISWAHGTTGIARKCAPSAVENPAQDAKFYFFTNSSDDFDIGVPALTAMIAAGYVVVATDYNGLGAPGVHHYAIGQSEGQNVLDAAVAAQKVLDAKAGKKVVVIGWSQGGQAAVYAAELADYVKNSATVVGAVALAPVNGVEQLKIMNEMIAAGKKFPATTSAEQVMALYAMTQVWPELKLSDVLTDEGIKYINETCTTQCSHHMADSLSYMVNTLGISALRSNPVNQDAWMKRYKENSIGSIKSNVPIAVLQGVQDLSIFPAATAAYVLQACADGTTVFFKEYPEADHLRLSAIAQPDFLTWIADRFTGKPAPSTCAKPQ